MTDGRYPIPLAHDDFRYGLALTAAVARVLAEFGYPNIFDFYDGGGADFDRLQHMLVAFLYGGPTQTPIEIRLAGAPEAVTHAAKVLGHIFAITRVAGPYEGRDGRVRIYLTGGGTPSKEASR